MKKNKIGSQTIEFKKKPCIKNAASVVGNKEAEGPLSPFFDYIMTDAYANQKSWEQAESKLQEKALEILLEKEKIKFTDLDYIYGGDLLNQCTGAGYGVRDTNVPFFGIYGACSTSVEALILSAMAIDGEYAEKVIAITSSHFCSAEKQFRFPLEYGGQRPQSAQWTVTGSGAFLVSDKGSSIKITHATVGKIVDMGVCDANNMGAAMAPAAADTILAHLKDTKRSLGDYDLIVTGDLGKVGKDILTQLLDESGIDIREKHTDCGLMIFDGSKQDTHAGGSGCGCAATVLGGYLLKMFNQRRLNRILFLATGALMSPLLLLQNESIPSIAHAIAIEYAEEV